MTGTEIKVEMSRVSVREALGLVLPPRMTDQIVYTALSISRAGSKAFDVPISPEGAEKLTAHEAARNLYGIRHYAPDSDPESWVQRTFEASYKAVVAILKARDEEGATHVFVPKAFQPATMLMDHIANTIHLSEKIVAATDSEHPNS